MEIQSKYKILEEIVFREGNGLYAGKITGIRWNENKKSFVYEITTNTGGESYYDESDIHPLYSYMVADTETGMVKNIVEKDEKTI